MTAIVNPVLDGFHQWLLSAMKFSKSSADSYCHGIGKINEDVFKPATKGNDMFLALGKAIANGTAVDWLKALEGILNYQIEQALKPDKKPLQDKRCRLRKFIDYALLLQKEWSTKQLDVNTSYVSIGEYVPKGIQFYDTASLKKYFCSKFINSDLFLDEGNMIFPISVLNYYANEAEKEDNLRYMQSVGIAKTDGKPINLSGDFQKAVENCISRLKFRTERNLYTLNEINGILICNPERKVYVKVGNHKHLVLDEGDTGNLFPLKAFDLYCLRVLFQQKIAEVIMRKVEMFPTFSLFTKIIETNSERNKAISPIRDLEYIKQKDNDQHFRLRIFVEFLRKTAFSEIAHLLPLLLVELNYVISGLNLNVSGLPENYKGHAEQIQNSIRRINEKRNKSLTEKK